MDESDLPQRFLRSAGSVEDYGAKVLDVKECVLVHLGQFEKGGVNMMALKEVDPEEVIGPFIGCLSGLPIHDGLEQSLVESTLEGG